MSIETRLRNLEAWAAPAHGYVILMGDDETSEQAIAAAGIEPGEHDLVILVGKMRQIATAENRLVNEFEVRS